MIGISAAFIGNYHCMLISSCANFLYSLEVVYVICILCDEAKLGMLKFPQFSNNVDYNQFCLQTMHPYHDSVRVLYGATFDGPIQLGAKLVINYWPLLLSQI